jgi:hypothetical protein
MLTESILLSPSLGMSFVVVITHNLLGSHHPINKKKVEKLKNIDFP